jgi:uncharacterized protein (DUF433 family)
MSHDNLSRLTAPRYERAEAAELARVEPSALGRWFRDGVFVDQAIGSLVNGKPAWSFLQIVESFVVGRLIDSGCTLPWVASLRERARSTLGVDQPFATHRFRLAGNELVCSLEDSPLGLPGAVEEDLLRLDYGPQELDYLAVEEAGATFVDHDYACRFHPYGRSAPLVIDPCIYSGRLTVSGTRIPASTICGRHRRGESVSSLADDFELAEETVARVLQFAK